MPDSFRIVDLSDDEAVHALSRVIREWEPHLEFRVERASGRLYDPDGTLYAIMLSNTATLRANRRDRVVSRGDAVIIPRGMAIDIEPDVDVVAIGHDGLPPDHFRERFLQIWGFEHRPAPDPGVISVTEICGPETRHRLSYLLLDQAPERVYEESGREVLLLILPFEPFKGACRLDGIGIKSEEIRPGQIALLAPETKVRIGGAGRVGLIRLPTEWAFERGITPGHNPEYQPPRPDAKGKAGDGLVPAC